MSKTVAFDRVKVTNNQQDNDPFHVGLLTSLLQSAFPPGLAALPIVPAVGTRICHLSANIWTNLVKSITADATLNFATGRRAFSHATQAIVWALTVCRRPNNRLAGENAPGEIRSG